MNNQGCRGWNLQSNTPTIQSRINYSSVSFISAIYVARVWYVNALAHIQNDMLQIQETENLTTMQPHTITFSNKWKSIWQLVTLNDERRILISKMDLSASCYICKPSQRRCKVMIMRIKICRTSQRWSCVRFVVNMEFFWPGSDYGKQIMAALWPKLLYHLLRVLMRNRKTPQPAQRNRQTPQPALLSVTTGSICLNFNRVRIQE